MGPKEEILLSLIQSPQAEAWAKSWAAQNRGWHESSNLDGCGWEGIRCDPVDYSVTSIMLPNVGIFGTIPPGIGEFTNLEVMTLPGNHFVGTVPKKVLDLLNLVRFDVSGSTLEGPFPLFQSTVINYLNLEGNSFGGALPMNFGDRFPALTTLNLGKNSFLGFLPDSITDLANLEQLIVSYNRFVGTIPGDLGKLSLLEELSMSNNFFVGTIPRSLANPHSKLVQIFIQDNALSGSVPAELSEIPNLVTFFIDGNKLTGTVPHELCAKPINDAYFADMKDAEFRGGCESIACPVNSQSVAGIFPCQMCAENRISPYLGHNGNCIAVDQRHILDSFYNDAGGKSWVGAGRWSNPSVPVCEFEGVECDEGGHIVNMTLVQMNLHGTINEKLGRLRHLRRLILADNHLTGIVPSDLRFAPLVTLDLSGNQLNGPIPPMLCLAGGINGNGDGESYGCDVIACPAGTWHPRGFAKADGGSCMPCPGGGSFNFVGQRSCILTTVSSFERIGQVAHDNMGFFSFGIVALFGIIAIVAHFVIGRRSRVVPEKRSGLSEYKDDTLDDPSDLKSFAEDDGAYSVEPEELTVISYGRQRRVSLPNSAPGLDTSIPKEAAVVSTLRQRDRSPADDPDTQDLWLDVPKIA